MASVRDFSVSSEWKEYQKQVSPAGVEATMCSTLGLRNPFRAATNPALTVAPFLIIRKLTMVRSTRVAPSILIGMSILTMAACTLEAVGIDRLSKSKDLTYETAHFMIWLALERYVAIISVSIPNIRPLVLSIHPKHPT